MIPDRLVDWSYNKIKELVDKNNNESRTHDFKSNLPDSIELTKDCCAFANTIPVFQLGNFISIPDSEKVLAVVYVPKSHRPHIPSQKELRIFWKRTNTGNEQMTYKEIKESFRQALIKQNEVGIGEIKFRILFVLYKKHYSGQAGHPQLTSDVIEEGALKAAVFQFYFLKSLRFFDTRYR